MLIAVDKEMEFAPISKDDTDKLDELEDVEYNIVRAEVTKQDFSLDKKGNRYSWFVVTLLLLMQISNQW